MMQTKGFENESAITIGGIQLDEYLGLRNKIDPTTPSEITTDFDSTHQGLKRIIYHKPVMKVKEPSIAGKVKEYTIMEMFNHVLKQCDPSIMSAFENKATTKKKKIVKLYGIFKSLDHKFKLADASVKMKDSGLGDPARYCYLLYQAGLLKKDEIDGAINYSKVSMNDTELIRELIDKDNLMIGYGTKPSERVHKSSIKPLIENMPRDFSVGEEKSLSFTQVPSGDFFSLLADKLRTEYGTIKKILPSINEEEFLKLYIAHGGKIG